MRIAIILMIFCIFFISCKNEKKKVVVSNLYETRNFSNLPIVSKNNAVDTLVKDSFSRRTSKITCTKKQTIAYSGYTFTFCKDSVEKILDVEEPNKLIADEFNTIISLCRQIPFSLTETKTKRNIVAVHYKETGAQKSFCFELNSKRPNKCIGSFIIH